MRSTESKEIRNCSRHFHHRGPPNLLMGIVLIGVGVLLLLQQVDVIAPHISIWQFWPLFLIGIGVSHLARSRTIGGVVFALVVAVIGTGFLLQNLGFAELGLGRLWPFGLVALGVYVLFHKRTHHRFHNGSSSDVSSDVLEHEATMSGLALKVDSQAFKGGTLTATMGGIEVDLRQAKLAPEGATLDIRCVMGAIELRVPVEWRVVNKVTPSLGGVEDATNHGLPRDEEGPSLVVRGTVLLGALELKN